MPVSSCKDQLNSEDILRGQTPWVILSGIELVNTILKKKQTNLQGCESRLDACGNRNLQIGEDLTEDYQLTSDIDTWKRATCLHVGWNRLMITRIAWVQKRERETKTIKTCVTGWRNYCGEKLRCKHFGSLVCLPEWNQSGHMRRTLSQQAHKERAVQLLTKGRDWLRNNNCWQGWSELSLNIYIYIYISSSCQHPHWD